MVAMQGEMQLQCWAPPLLATLTQYFVYRAHAIVCFCYYYSLLSLLCLIMIIVIVIILITFIAK